MSDTMTTPAGHRTLHDWFAASAAAHGPLPALEAAGRVVSYAELDALAGRIAAALLEHLGGRAPRRVGLLAGRTLVAYAGYLAVQRLGAAVVPLGPAFPHARHVTVARAAALDAVLADEHAAPGLTLPAPVLRLTDTALDALDAGSAPPPVPGGPGDLAYILFTSGSTGVPKGVPVLQRNADAFLRQVVPAHDAGPGARLSQTFDLTFDPSVFDMFCAWGSGATLVVPDRAELMTPVRFAARRELTHWNSVPSLVSLARRLRQLRPDSLPALRRSVFCGEPLTLQQAEAWRLAAPHSTVENAYGPTELTVTCTSHHLPRESGDWPRTSNGTVPIGRPYPGLEALVRDGELCLRGPQRFPGYLDPADNAGRFLAPDGAPWDPATELGDDHWYRTGDRVTALPDGGYLHQGRLDQQVQVNGYRVELGEVEAALREQAGVTEAAVIAVANAGGGTELAAACSGPGPAHAAALTEALRARLPGYMVPATLTVLDALPLNANGKTDRTTLRTLLTAA
ncbi:AMP-binding protein [Streptomyces sp. NBC_00162]|uniref:AMP-binding protein n=1 Tax=Streptomyces sp. NBC_00162 TaxID=2903629 RepID=UPI00214C2FE1|nr:AMP-binding protein [Streptomyces sp. NBC_00162]UUU43754.1 AMP-binding protein [Streptomyces sp. NBC_00162]